MSVLLSFNGLRLGSCLLLLIFGCVQAMAGDSSFVQANTTEEFNEIVVAGSGDLPVMVEFYADWCAYCQELQPLLEGAAAEVDGQLNVVRVNVDLNESLAQRFGVSGLPTLIFFDRGMALNRIEGVPSREWLRELLLAYARDNTKPPTEK